MSDDDAVLPQRSLPLCRQTKVDGGTEWICLQPAHDEPDPDELRGVWDHSHVPRADRHAFVPRWPNR